MKSKYFKPYQSSLEFDISEWIDIVHCKIKQNDMIKHPLNYTHRKQLQTLANLIIMTLKWLRDFHYD